VTARSFARSTSKQPASEAHLISAYVVRHAKAGDREEWKGDDQLRPLNKAGFHQAEALAEALKNAPIDKILSSPYVRCVQTVEPMARQRRLPVDQTKELQEGAGGESVVGLVKKYSGKQVVLCTHGDVVEELLERLIADGLVQRARANMEKGSTWVLEEAAGKVTGARYLAAP
jgi:phosphohistidine phosphatase SixA